MYEERRRPSLASRVLGGLDGLRRFLINVLFFGLLIGLLVASFSGRPTVPDGSALVLNPKGVIVEQLSAVDPVERVVSRGSGAAEARETLLKDLLDALRFAKEDSRIKAVYLDTNDMAGAGFTKLRDLRDALAEFKKSGKKVIAYGDSFLQSPYYLAAQADEVHLHPEGMVLIQGFGGYRQY
jgi:protease-4